MKRARLSAMVGDVKNLARRALAMQRRHPMAADAVVALVFAAAALLSVYANFEAARRFDPLFDPPGTVAIVIGMLAVAVPLAWRRRFPLLATIAVIVAFSLGRIVLDPVEPYITVWACWLALYSAAAHGRPRWRTLVLGIAVGVIAAEVVRELFFLGPDLKGLVLTRSFLVAYNVVVLVFPWVLGAAIRSLRERERELAERAAELQREREENARRAVFEERVRIARELHDVVAHHVSVMGVQAGAARRVMDRQPERATEALSSIETSSRQAVVELHRLLGFLRRAGDADEFGPQPGLAQLEDLIAQMVKGALTVDLVVEGDARPLPPTLDVSAYRIIQEALTNSLKHSGALTTAVRVRYRPASLEIEVLDDGRDGPGQPIVGVGGHGLIGMRERASLHGGTLSAGPRPEGGFVVHATFPLNGLLP